MSQFWIALFAAWTLLLAPRALAEVDIAELESGIHAAAGYLERAAGENGEFVYRVNTNPKVKVKPKYNILRHAGSIYAMATYAGELGAGEGLHTALKRTAGFMLRETLAPVHLGDASLQAIWSLPEINHSGEPRQAKLGGAGLALVALGGLRDAGLDPAPLHALRALGEFILMMQKPDGSFYSKYVPSQPDPFSKWVSLYYPGEAALGLLHLYRLDPQPRWLEAAARALKYLSDRRKPMGPELVEPDHWALIATRELLPHADRISKVISVAELTGHARKIVERMLKDLSGHETRTTPVSTRLEGLLAVYPLMARIDPALAESMRRAIDGGVRFVLDAQLRGGRYRGGIPRGVDTFHGLEPRATEIRIDYVQHALSAFMEYRKVRESPAEARARPGHPAARAR